MSHKKRNKRQVAVAAGPVSTPAGQRSFWWPAGTIFLGLVVITTVWWWKRASTRPSSGISATMGARTETGQDVELESVVTAGARAQRREREAVLNTPDDGWQAEHLGKEVSQQLRRLGQFLEHPEAHHLEELMAVASGEFSGTSLRPENRQVVFDETFLSVSRAPTGQMQHDYRGVQGLFEALALLRYGLSEMHVKFKVFRVESAEAVVKTSSYYEASGRGAEGAVQQNGVWDCTWRHDNQTDQLRLESVTVRQYEEVKLSSNTPTLFADCTEDVLGSCESYHRQLQYGIDYWLSRIETNLMIHYFGHHGLAVGDINGDGLEDVYVCQPGSLPNCLFVQQADGTVRDQAARAGVHVRDFTRSALLLDLDNDGDQDLAMSCAQKFLVFSNDGHGRFRLRVKQLEGHGAQSLSAADYDDDGDLDIYACNYVLSMEEGRQFPVPVPYHDANNGGANILLRNEGNWKFSDATNETGLDQNNHRFSFAAAWEDYDNDGDQDLYVANDYGRNNLYENRGGHFSDVAEKLGVEDIAAGMSVSWGDYDRNGRMDLYVGNMFSSAGNRVAYQRNFQADADDDIRGLYQRHARGNSLFKSQKNGTFEDVSIGSGVTMGRWSWSSLFADINNDGWEDLSILNGMRTGENPADL